MSGRAKAELVKLPSDPAAASERELRRAWQEIDEIEQKLRTAKAAARPLEHAVWRAEGNYGSPTREALERLLGVR